MKYCMDREIARLTDELNEINRQDQLDLLKLVEAMDALGRLHHKALGDMVDVFKSFIKTPGRSKEKIR